MMPKISRWLLKLWGWKLTGKVTMNRCVIIVIPHTSNWDFPLGVLVRSAIDKNIRFMGKASLFRFPFGFIFKALGGYPVERTANHNYVENVINTLENHGDLGICIAPEGTRRKVTKLKTGFYFIAKGANIPIVMCKFDWKNRIVDFAEPFYTTDFEKDMEHIKNYYDGVEGKVKENGFVFE